MPLSRSPRGRVTLRALFLAIAVVYAAPAAAQQQQAMRRLSSGVDSTNFDRSVRAQDDFFRFVNGGWLARTQIPADQESTSHADLPASSWNNRCLFGHR